MLASLLYFNVVSFCCCCRCRLCCCYCCCYCWPWRKMKLQMIVGWLQQQLLCPILHLVAENERRLPSSIQPKHAESMMIPTPTSAIVGSATFSSRNPDAKSNWLYNIRKKIPRSCMLHLRDSSSQFFSIEESLCYNFWRIYPHWQALPDRCFQFPSQFLPLLCHEISK